MNLGYTFSITTGTSNQVSDEIKVLITPVEELEEFKELMERYRSINNEKDHLIKTLSYKYSTQLSYYGDLSDNIIYIDKKNKMYDNLCKVINQMHMDVLDDTTRDESISPNKHIDDLISPIFTFSESDYHMQPVWPPPKFNNDFVILYTLNKSTTNGNILLLTLYKGIVIGMWQ